MTSWPVSSADRVKLPKRSEPVDGQRAVDVSCVDGLVDAVGDPEGRFGCREAGPCDRLSDRMNNL